MSIIARIRAAIRLNSYEYSWHALEEMDEDDLSDADVRQAILDGGVRAELTDDPRGIRYIVKLSKASLTMLKSRSWCASFPTIERESSQYMFRKR